jgi:CubicO group peptidase (beta-lactamase class C family)
LYTYFWKSEVWMKRFYSYLIVFSLVLFLMPSCNKEPSLGETLEAEIPRLMEAADIPGLSVAVIRNGEIFWSGAFGVRSRETNEPVDENTIFEAASLTKTITAAAALKLMEQGVMELDSPLSEYLPYPRLAGDERYKKITARHVLTHTTGLPNWGNKLLREPGELYGYSGEGFLYLGRTLEKLTGMTLEEFARKEIFEPLGMSRTSYVWTDLYAANGASGHDRHGFTNPLRQRTDPNGGASLLTTANDYATFLCAIMKNQILKPETIEMMLTPHVTAASRREEGKLDDHISWGFGWGIQPGNIENGFWHWGDNGDLRAFTVSYKGRKEGLVFFANSENLFAIAESLISLLIDDPQYAFGWLTYKRLDEMANDARLKIEKVFVSGDIEAGIKMLEEMKNQESETLKTQDLNRMARYLTEREKNDEAEAILKYVLQSDQKSASAWYSLGRFYFETGRNKEALDPLQKALELDPKNPFAKQSLPWVKEVIQAEEKPIVIPEETLVKYAGTYGPRHVRFQEGRLYYQREGRNEYELVPLSQDTFSLKNRSIFRLRFVSDESGKVLKVIGIYIDDRTDESLRTDYGEID